MNYKLKSFFNSISGKSVCFIGMGVSHRELVKIFANNNIQVSVCDRSEREYLENIDELEAMGVKFYLGNDYLEHLDSDIIFRTPGMKYYTPELVEARKQNKVVTSELELFIDLCPCKIIGITGSDGKTTTSTIISEMLKAEGKKVHLGGNIGKALLPIVDSISVDDIAVVELSSFQLISMRKSPDISIITNITPNHLDMHSSMQEYVDAKRNIYLHQTSFGKTVLNMDNEITSSFSEEVICGLNMFSRKNKPRFGAYLSDDNYIYMSIDNKDIKLFDSNDIKLLGMHNVENYMAAISAVWGLVSVENMHKVAQEFSGVEHRIEFVRELNGVKWYNDSIATTPTSTIAGLDSFEEDIVLIAGGYDKKLPFLQLASKIIQKVKALILVGDSAKKIYSTVESISGYDPEKIHMYIVENMEEAVQLANQEATKGDVVTLSPACASYDMYRNFEVRGRHFKELVNKLD